MEFFDRISAEPLILLIPIISAVVGWGTNVLAIKMMFFPVDFVGIKPFLGWQGIIPANALRLANTGLKLVTSKLLKVKELFEDFDSAEFVGEYGESMKALTRKMIEEKAAERFPQMWNALSPQIKEQVFAVAEAEVVKIAAGVMDDAAEGIEELMNIQQVVTDAVMADKTLMNRVFLKVGEQEFKFIARSGLYFGFLFGLVQLVVYVLYPAAWVLPFFGFLVGYATNWLALKLIFEPKEPKKILGWTVQGLFHRRQNDIAREFADIISRQVFNQDNLFNELSKEIPKKKLLAMVQVRAELLLTSYQSNPMMAMMATPDLVAELEAELLREVEGEMYKRPGGMIEAFVNKSGEIREKLMTRMAVMDADGFEDVLRPAFKQDEWKLILAGAALGLVAGIVQLVGLFADFGA